MINAYVYVGAANATLSSPPAKNDLSFFWLILFISIIKFTFQFIYSLKIGLSVSFWSPFVHEMNKLEYRINELNESYFVQKIGLLHFSPVIRI